jgi:serine protease Do
VVNVYTTRRLRDTLNPFFDESIWRDLFGGKDWGALIPRERRTRSLGSGVLVSADGYILTNNHVVEGADGIQVVLADGKEYAAKLIGADEPTDVAILRIEASDLPAIVITDSERVEVGDAVLAIGNPFGVGQTVTVGHVSGLGRGGMGIVDYEDFIQTDASINPGNSGGALVDAEGRLIGINTAMLSGTGRNQGIGFAVPINLARSVMERIIKDGKVTRGYLGVMVQPVTEDLAKEFKLPRATGALVAEVARGSPAADAGVKEGDIILEFDGKKVSDSRHLRLMVAQTAPDTTVTLMLSRDGKEQTLTVKLEELRRTGMNRSGEAEDRRSARELDDLFDGVSVGDLDARTRREFDIPLSVRGAVVMAVDAYSAAALAGLRTGDVIMEIDRRTVRNADEAIEQSRRRAGQRVLLRVWSKGSSHYVIVRSSAHGD